MNVFIDGVPAAYAYKVEIIINQKPDADGNKRKDHVAVHTCVKGDKKLLADNPGLNTVIGIVYGHLDRMDETGLYVSRAREVYT